MSITNAFILLAAVPTIITSSALSFSAETSAITDARYKFRPYDPTRISDRSSLEEICASVYGGSDYLPAVASSYVEDPACSFLALTKNNENKELNSAEENDRDEILAVANYKRLPAQNSAWIEAVRTHPNYRNQGLASTLLRFIVEIAKKESESSKPTNLLTCTIQSNKGMLRAFEKVGFTQCNKIQLLSMEKCMRLPGWKSDCDKAPQSLLDALNLRELVSPRAKSMSWRPISTEQELLHELEQCKREGGTCGYLPGLYEYIVPGNRLDLKQILEHGLAFVLDLPSQKESSGYEIDGEAGHLAEENEVGHAILVLTRDERITSLKSKWICSIVAHTQLTFEAALWHAHSLDVTNQMKYFQHGDNSDTTKNGMKKSTVSSMPFCLAFDDALRLRPGTLAHALPLVTDKCVVLQYKGNNMQ